MAHSGRPVLAGGLVTAASGTAAAATCPAQGHRIKTPDDPSVYLPKVYFYDAYHGGWRWITSQSVFDRYGFAASKIVATPDVSPVGPNWS